MRGGTGPRRAQRGQLRDTPQHPTACTLAAGCLGEGSQVPPPSDPQSMWRGLTPYLEETEEGSTCDTTPPTSPKAGGQNPLGKFSRPPLFEG